MIDMDQQKYLYNGDCSITVIPLSLSLSLSLSLLLLIADYFISSTPAPESEHNSQPGSEIKTDDLTVFPEEIFLHGQHLLLTTAVQHLYLLSYSQNHSAKLLTGSNLKIDKFATLWCFTTVLTSDGSLASLPRYISTQVNPRVLY